MRKGFTLLEISVVLMVIGLLIGGIIMAQSLIRSSKVQTIVQDVAAYQGAIAQFKQKYGAIPGDMANAGNYWSTVSSGNGDGHITLDTTSPYEQFLVWQHLADGGFISGSYTGTSVAGAAQAAYYCAPGVNCPGGSITQSQAYFLQYYNSTSTTYHWLQPPGHYLIVGNSVATVATDSTEYPGYPLLTAAEAFSLDSKVDDGLPGLGTWKSFEIGKDGYIPNCVLASSSSTSAPTDGTYSSESTAIYNVASKTNNIVSSSNPTCSLMINLNF